MRGRRSRQIVVGMLAALLIASAALAQWGYRRSRYPPRLKPPGQADNGFSFCRLVYQSGQWGRGRWSTDYPFADINFMVRLSELTSTSVNFDDHGEPNHWTVPITDEAPFSCPFMMASAVGTMLLSEEEALRLREYLLKGGFLWADDFWGTLEWEQWATEISKVLL